MTRPRGLYDEVLTTALAARIGELESDAATIRDLEASETGERLKDVFGLQLQRILADLPGENRERIGKQLSLVNSLLAHLRDVGLAQDSLIDPVAEPARLLESIYPRQTTPPTSPATGLASPWLFTAGKGTPALLEELRREASSCDRIDMLVSFITVSGVRKLLDILRTITASDAQGSGKTTIRVLTTTYTGATQIDALDALARLNGATIKVSLDGRRTRLHAKAWLFQRRTGFGSAYVGSANLSGAALMGGLEWTVKFTERGDPSLFSRALAHFDTLWEDDEFQEYHPDNAEARAALIKALQVERGEAHGTIGTYFDLQPKQYQREMLAQLEAEREHGRRKNLLVSATGTGKTVVAAFDYRATCERLGYRPRLLFVAHRAQILRQALRTYREVLKDNSFGEILVGGMTPASYDFLFASIDSLTTRNLATTLGASHWHSVVIDECHRIAAQRFDDLVTQLQPDQLLGLTATPERTDGQPISPYFTNRPDGSPAVELRLWDALDMQLLAPFEYYACDDDTDFSQVPWDRPGEVAAVDQLVTGNDVRARLVIQEWERLAANPRRGKTIVFCVSVAHARFMADRFNASGLPARCVLGESSLMERQRALHELAAGDICALVTVDLFNEGVDLPNVDTLLLLRPTQSALLFQQQIGRGLRLAPGKDSCLILDFVGQHRAEFRFDHLLGSITGLTRAQMIDAVEHGFSTLPPGCHIQLQQQSRAQVLRSLRSLTHHRWQKLGAELASYAAINNAPRITLGRFLHDQRIALADIYRDSAPSGWTTLRRAAGVIQGEESEGESQLSRRLGALLHNDDPEYLRVMGEIARVGTGFTPASPADALRAQMLTYQVDTSHEAMDYKSFIRHIAQHPYCAEELGELAVILTGLGATNQRPVPGFEDVPLSLHGRYSTNEIRTAVGAMDATHRTPFQAGVLSIARRRTELLFVTLDKSTGYHDRIAYSDHAISPWRFHWQTMNAAGPDTPVGRRYLESPANGWSFQLFVRTAKRTPYRPCGPVRLAAPEDVSGDRPMSIKWQLEVPLPPSLFREFSVLRDA